MVNIWVDADACPGPVKDIVLKTAVRRGVKTVFVANKKIAIPETELLSAVQVGLGPDVADEYIAEHAISGDLVITQDIHLAAKLVKQTVTVIDPRGDCYSEENIGDRLSTRDLMHELRSTGEITGGHGQFGEKEKRKFANAFDRELTKCLRAASR